MLPLAAALALAVTGCTTSGHSAISETSSSSPTSSAVSRTAATPPASPVLPSATTALPSTTATIDARSLLQTLAVRQALPLAGYERVNDFGPAWADVDGQPCDTRDQILSRDLTNITKRGSCEVTSGVLHDPYTGKVIDFVRGVKTSSAVQIDHLVPLAEVWMTGGQGLTSAQREHLAEDPLELLAVDGPTNEAKGDGDASQWLPPRSSFRCQYVADQVAVKAKYDLWVTPAEDAAIASVLSSCPSIQILREPGVSPIAPTQPAAPPAPAAPTANVPAPVPQAPPAASSGAVIWPGAICSVVGATGRSSAGKTYTCGSKGADARGRFHWNS
jgi:hypothetical protein